MDDESGRWGFYSLLAKMGLVLGVGGGLFLLARRGDTTAIAILAGLCTLALLALGLGAALLVFDRTAQAEQRRFTANARENMAYLEQQQRLLNAQLQAQGRQASNLLRENEQLVRRLPGPASPALGLDLDALDWDLLPADLAEDQGRQR